MKHGTAAPETRSRSVPVVSRASRRSAPAVVEARLPPRDLAGLDPHWSRLVCARDPQGVERTWHVLDTAQAGPPAEGGLTVLCVHGNPTWSYLWRDVATAIGPPHRVVAVDHLGMGFSERTGRTHRLADRVAELCCVTEALGIDGPVVTVGHDWGGAISLGWGLAHREQLAGLVLTNTAVAQPEGAPFPPLLGLVRLRGLMRTSTVRTSAFVDGTLRLAHPRLTPEVRRAYRSPYLSAPLRQGVGDFVADIPLTADHPSHAALVRLQERLSELVDVPSLLLWGSRDPVFSDRYLRDLQHRLPNARLQRYPLAGHLVVEDAPVAAAVTTFLRDLEPARDDFAMPNPPEATEPPRQAAERRTLWRELTLRQHDDRPALVELVGGRRRTVTWRQLSNRVDRLAAGLAAWGVAPGQRLGLLVPPGADLMATVYACWRLGAVVVVADAGLGLSGLRRALRDADLDYVVGGTRGLAVARALRLPGRRIAAGPMTAVERIAVRVDATLAELATRGGREPLPAPPSRDDVAAVLFTSGATGPAKGVVYRHRQLEAQRDAVAAMVGLQPDDRLVAAFAPFALYGPAVGITSVVPDMDVTAPATLSARALHDAVAAVDATLVFASPAALRNIVATADDVDGLPFGRVRCLLTSGAPIARETLGAASRLLGGCKAHTPYGMTEVLLVSDITLAELDAVGDGQGVCVGRPVRAVDVAVSPLDGDGHATGGLTTRADVTGEIVVRADHVKDHYDQLWVTQQESVSPQGWHRTGDVGHLDEVGRLWVEGRLVHVVVTDDGVVTPVGAEQDLERLDFVRLASVVGVGPSGCQQVVAVVEAMDPVRRARQASLAELDAMRRVVDPPVSAAFVVPSLPVDIRHNSKIDRARVARWAARVLSGERATAL